MASAIVWIGVRGLLSDIPSAPPAIYRANVEDIYEGDYQFVGVGILIGQTFLGETVELSLNREALAIEEMTAWLRSKDREDLIPEIKRYLTSQSR